MTPEIYAAAEAYIRDEIIAEIGIERAQQLKQIVDNDELEFGLLSNGLPTQIPKRLRLIREAVRALPQNQRKKAKKVWRKIQLARRGVIQNEDGYWLIDAAGNLTRPTPKQEDIFADE